MSDRLFDSEKFYELVGKELSVSKRLLANPIHAKWLLIISYLFHDYDYTKMLEIYHNIFGRNITDVHSLDYKNKWYALQKNYPELDLPYLGDGFIGDSVSTYPKFVAIRAKLLTYVPELQQYVA